jgi:hypothetical protein
LPDSLILLLGGLISALTSKFIDRGNGTCFRMALLNTLSLVGFSIDGFKMGEDPSSPKEW